MGRSGIGGFDRERLRAVRERVGLTQRDLAERLLRATRAEWPGSEISRAAQDLDNVRLQITDYEAGQVTPRAKMIYQLARALGVDVFELLAPETPYTLEILRARRGLRQADVVEQGLGVGRAYYSRVERGAARLSDEPSRRLADILDVSAADLAAAIDGGHTIGSMTAVRERTGRRRTRSAT
ncbi:MAG TPA: helix-turn-helix transcriptional regulator [Micromonosporaceae bacterium]|nr:helix-turn-helix transcriptional regulator [Micromonosporaceae bacterium]